MFQLCSLKLVQLNLIGNEAAKLLAEIIGKVSVLKITFPIHWTPENFGEPVLMTLGGGHYAPKANKLALQENVWVGHMLANHSLPFGSQEDPGILWKQSIDAALSSTKKAFPGGKVICNVEKKSFKGWQRQLIYEHLESVGIEVVRTNAFWNGQRMPAAVAGVVKSCCQNSSWQ